MPARKTEKYKVTRGTALRIYSMLMTEEFALWYEREFIPHIEGGGQPGDSDYNTELSLILDDIQNMM